MFFVVFKRSNTAPTTVTMSATVDVAVELRRHSRKYFACPSFVAQSLLLSVHRGSWRKYNKSFSRANSIQIQVKSPFYSHVISFALMTIVGFSFKSPVHCKNKKIVFPLLMVWDLFFFVTYSVFLVKFKLQAADIICVHSELYNIRLYLSLNIFHWLDNIFN